MAGSGRRLREVDDLHAELLGQEGKKILLAGEPAFEEDKMQRLGAGAGQFIPQDRHIRFAQPTPLANLHLTLLDKVGVRLDAFVDSRGKVGELFDPLPM